MSVFRADCPRCGTRSVALEINYEIMFKTIDDANRGMLDDTQSAWDTFSICGCCHRGIVVTFLVQGTREPSECLEENIEIKRIEMAPKPQESEVPLYTPPNVARYYSQGLDSVNRGNWDAAGGMFRKALAFGLKEAFPEIESCSKGELHNCIKEAESQQGLTPALAEWAHRIRLDGNEALHEEQFSADDARSISKFSELLFHYLFALPGMLKEARENHDEPDLSDDD